MASTHLPRRLTYLVPAVLVVLCANAFLYAADSPPMTGSRALSVDDQKLLAELIKGFVFDPAGAERVQISTVARSPWDGSATVPREGWFVKGTAKSPDRVYFVDDESTSVADPKHLRKVDFVAACAARLEQQKTPPQTPDARRRTRRREMRRTATGQVDDSFLVLAAWLHRLGHDDLAAQALKSARAEAADDDQKSDDKKLVARLRSDLAWSAFSGLVNAFMVSADEQAQAAGERLLRLYPEEAKEYSQAAAIMADLERRKKAGTFGKKTSMALPSDFGDWKIEQKVVHLIEALDQVDARQMSQPGNVTLAMDRRVAALIEIGDPAVPALIDAIESDGRLTRSVHFWRDFSRDRTVLSVREAALEALMSITRTQFFTSRATGDNFTKHGDAAAKQIAAHLRAYWKKYGQFPFDERMMKVLTDPDSRSEATREAAYNLAHLEEKRVLSTSGAHITWSLRDGQSRKTPSAAVGKFKNPKAAEAILAAMDRDLRDYDSHPRDDLYDFRRREIEAQYMEPLIDLGDRSIAAELSRRYKSAETIRGRRSLANAAHQLGQPGAMTEFARDVERGTLKLPVNDRQNTNADDQPGNVELRGIVQDLARTGMPEANRALSAIAEPNHPYYQIALSAVLKTDPHWPGNGGWFSHPYFLKILRRELDNTAPTGSSYRIEGTRLIQRNKDGSSAEMDVPTWLADPGSRRAQAIERRCDRAAEKMRDFVIGLPAYSPLQRDADKALDKLKLVFDYFPNGFRRVTALEAEFLGVFRDQAAFIPDMPPLGRPATADDVKAGRAVFHLNGKGTLAKLQLPAVAFPKEREKARRDQFGRPIPMMIVQAEIDADGNVVYGAIGDGVGRTARAEELSDIKPIKKSFSFFGLFK